MAAIVLTGVVQDGGSVKVEGKVDLPSGSRVRLLVHPEQHVPIGLTLAEALKFEVKEMTPEEEEALYHEATARFLEAGGHDLGLPEDYADELDHYLYGTPKRASEKE